MSDVVTQCARCGAVNAPRISSWIGFPQELKARILQDVCDSCWEAWKATQLMALNEYRLNLAREDHRAILAELGAEFLGIKAAGTSDGPPADDVSLKDLSEKWKPVEKGK